MEKFGSDGSPPMLGIANP